MDNKKLTINEIRNFNFPTHNGRDVTTELKNEIGYLCGISDEQRTKIARLWNHVYGHKINGNDSAHHYFLQGILEHLVVEYQFGHSRLCDECLLEVYEIAPELFDYEKIKAFYIKAEIFSNTKQIRFHINRISCIDHLQFFKLEIKEGDVTVLEEELTFDTTKEDICFSVELEDFLMENNIQGLKITEAVIEEENYFVANVEIGK